jgi:hypothetical protein
MTGRLNFCAPISFILEHALQNEVPSRVYALYNLLGPANLDRFVKLFPSIYNSTLKEFLGHKRSNPVDFQSELS